VLAYISESPPTLCMVCVLGEATSHVHYGTVAACNSCRAFFRRAVQGEKYANFICPRQQHKIVHDGDQQQPDHCEIKSKSWKSCQWCRFQKCLGAGMKTNWVWTKEQREQRLDVF
jgi:hypothetical protein